MIESNAEVRQYMRWEGVEAARVAGGEKRAPTPLAEEARRALVAMRRLRRPGPPAPRVLSASSDESGATTPMRARWSLRRATRQP